MHCERPDPRNFSRCLLQTVVRTYMADPYNDVWINEAGYCIDAPECTGAGSHLACDYKPSASRVTFRAFGF